jgi:hypothetical protein
MVATDGFFQRDDVMLLFTTSPAGLGHMRVTEALQSGIPENVRPEVIGIKDSGLQSLHRISSRNRFLRRVVEYVQNTPGIENVFATLYRESIRVRIEGVCSRIEELVDRRRPKPKALIIVSTHFGLAHKIAKAKARLIKELNMCVILCVIVTDDSSQKVWGVEGADYIFVPSGTTKNELTNYMISQKMVLPEFIVSPYPVSVKFERRLSGDEQRKRDIQLQANSKSKMKIDIPISGAAVQLGYFEELITYLDGKNLADILVVSRESKYTKDFLRWCEGVPSVEVVADVLDKDVVTSYEREIANGNYSIEITKPSEQTFKALLTPNQKGGLILLFSNPVGRQECDNVNFLTRHGLMPGPEDQRILQRLYHYSEGSTINSDFLKRARHWRGLMLPTKGAVAGRAIMRLRRAGILHSMFNFEGFLDHKELRGNGVQTFWNKLEKRVAEKCSLLGLA